MYGRISPMSESAVTFSVFWLIWGIIFIVIEVFALRNKTEGDTLTETISRLKKNNVVLGIFTLFWVVLSFHFFVT